jgi:hypothetical protein
MRRAFFVAGGLGAWYALHRLGRRSGASDAEVAAHLPGDELVPGPMWQSTRAVTIDAPPEAGSSRWVSRLTERAGTRRSGSTA